MKVHAANIKISGFGIQKSLAKTKKEKLTFKAFVLFV